MVLGLALATATFGAGGQARAATLVSNIAGELPDSGPGSRQAQSFETGTNIGGCRKDTLSPSKAMMRLSEMAIRWV